MHESSGRHRTEVRLDDFAELGDAEASAEQYQDPAGYGVGLGRADTLQVQQQALQAVLENRRAVEPIDL
jgi:hypothetical protein